MESEDLAEYLTAVFEDDWDILHPDVFPFTPGHEKYGDPVTGFEVNVSTPGAITGPTSIPSPPWVP